MAAVEVTISGVLYDKLNRTIQQVVLIGEASLTGLGVGGGPMPGGKPPGIWGGPIDPYPDIGGPGPQPPFPGHWPRPPVWGGGNPDFPIIGGGPIVPPNVPPGLTPPTPPNPGDPTTTVPPPAGSGGWPVQPIVVPPYIIVNYPGVGPVVVAPPATAAK